MLSKKKKQSSPEKLPTELEMKILSRLPVKSLIRFRCVSKRFRSLISDPYFVDLHLKQSEKRRKIFCPSPSPRTIDCVSLLDGNNSVDVVERNWALNLNNPDVMGTSNGLILIRVSSPVLFLYNPSTREFKILPKPPMRADGSGSGSHSYVYLGIMYDNSDNDYKVFMLTADGVKSSKGARLDVYSLRLSSWKRTQDMSCNSHLLRPSRDPPITYAGSDFLLHKSDPLFVYKGSCFCNGSFHWRVSDRRVLSFDISKQVFSQMSLDGIRGWLSGFGVFEECLYAMSWVESANGGLHEIWLSKDYGSKACWSKFVTIPERQVGRCLVPLCFLENGEALLRIHDEWNSIRLGSYCTKQNRLTKLADYRFTTFADCTPFPQEVLYVESLVSLR